MTRAFVSYSRRDTEFTKKLTDALIEQNMELWIDWKNIPPTVDWKLQIQKGVEEADTFLFLISPDSIKSGECAEEIVHAVKNGKRLIPLLVRPVDPVDLPKEIKHINWIDFNRNGIFDESFKNLLEAINTDYEWVQTLRRLQVKALEWERNNKDQSFLLRGSDLEAAEAQLLVNASKEPEPTEIQREYVLESKKAKEAERKAKEKQQRTITIASVVATVIMLFLSVWAVNNAREANIQRTEAETQRNEAKKQENIANANAKLAQDNEKEAIKNATLAKIGEISALAVGRIDQDYNEALLYSVEAYRQAEATGFNQESAKTALLTTLQSRRGLVQILPGHNDWVTSVVYSQDGKTIASSAWDNVTYLWDASDPDNPIKSAKLDGDDVAISSDNRIAATASFDEEFNDQITLWDISERTNPARLGTFSGTGIFDFTPNNNYLIVSNMDEESNSIIQIWDITNRIAPTLVNSLNGTNAYLSPSGSYLAVMSTDENYNTILALWDITSPGNLSQRSVISGDYSSMSRDQLAFSSDESMLAVSGYDDAYNSVVKLWNISNPGSPQELSTLSGNSDETSSLAISPDNVYLALGGNDGKIFIWDITDPENPRSSPSSDYFTGHTLLVSQIAFHPNSDTVVTGSYDGNLMVWDLKLTNPVQITASQGYPLAASWNGRMLASQYYNPESESYSTVLWDVSEPYKPVQLGELPGYANYAYFDPMGRSMVTLTSSFGEETTHSIVLWNITNPAFPTDQMLLEIPETFNNSITFNPEGTILFVGDYTKEITTLWDIANLDKPRQFGLIEQFVSDIDFSPDNSLLTLDVSREESETAIWDISQPGQYSQSGTIKGSGVAFSPDGKMFATGIEGSNGNSIVQLWDTATWKKRIPLKTLDGYAPEFSQNGMLLITRIAGEDDSAAEDILLWDLSNPKESKSQRLTGHTKDIRSIDFSPNNKLLSSASSDKTILVWDISNPAKPVKLTTLNGHSDWVTYVAFSANSFTLASGSYDGAVILWDVQDPKNIRQIGKLDGHTGIINSIQFPKDGRTLLTADSSETILWDVDPGSWIKKACNVVGSNFTQEQWIRLSLGEYHTTCDLVELATVPSTQPEVIVASSDSSTEMPLCSDAEGTSSCPLVTWNALENERDRFCIDSVSYTLYALPEGTTLTPIDKEYTCTDEGVRSGYQMYTCYSLEHPNTTFQATMCNAGCTVAQSDQCQSGFGLDLSQSCCTPVSSDGCMEVSLEIGGCT